MPDYNKERLQNLLDERERARLAKREFDDRMDEIQVLIMAECPWKRGDVINDGTRQLAICKIQGWDYPAVGSAYPLVYVAEVALLTKDKKRASKYNHFNKYLSPDKHPVVGKVGF